MLLSSMRHENNRKEGNVMHRYGFNNTYGNGTVSSGDEDRIGTTVVFDNAKDLNRWVNQQPLKREQITSREARKYMLNALRDTIFLPRKDYEQYGGRYTDYADRASMDDVVSKYRRLLREYQMTR